MSRPIKYRKMSYAKSMRDKMGKIVDELEVNNVSVIPDPQAKRCFSRLVGPWKGDKIEVTPKGIFVKPPFKVRRVSRNSFKFTKSNNKK